MPNTESGAGALLVPSTEQGGPLGEEAAGARLQALFAEVACLANQLRKTAAAVHSQGQSSAGGWGLLEILERLGPLTVPALARTRSLSRQSVQSLVNRLAAQGQVEILPNPAHKRSGLVQLTDRGARLLGTAKEREKDVWRAAATHVPAARLLSATKLLQRLRLLLAEARQPALEKEAKRRRRKRAPSVPVASSRVEEAVSVAVEAPAEVEPAGEEEDGFPVNLL
jgi:DNA-binding MarR family transcriptional regulator